jgi:alpha-L-rhamnosidase
MKDGEVYDARKKPSYSGKAVITTEKLTLVSSNNVRVSEHERFPAKLLTTPSGDKVLDFGQNIAGVIEFRVQGAAGQKLKLICGEILDGNGEFTQQNIQQKRPAKEFGLIGEIKLCLGKWKDSDLVPTPLQEVEFICSGGQDTYKMTFAVFGFQYAKIITDVAFDPKDFYAVAVYSDMEKAGDFSCSKWWNNFIKHRLEYEKQLP